MKKILIVSDDVTGSNAVAIRFSEQHLSAVTIFEREALVRNATHDVLVLSTNTRGVCANISYDQVKAGLEVADLTEFSLFSKRIDSTMRGNIGAEIRAFFDVLGDEYLAMIYPASPELGRVVENGDMLVNDVPLHSTAVAQDVLTPVTTSNVVDILTEQLPNIACYHIDSDTLDQGSETLVELLISLKERGYRAVIFDGRSLQDTQTVATSILQSKIPFFSVDPGGFSAEIVRRQRNFRVLSVVGTTNAVARRQLMVLFADPSVYSVGVSVANLICSRESYEREVARCTADILENFYAHRSLCIYNEGIHSANHIDLTSIAQKRNLSVETLRTTITEGFAEIAYQVRSAENNLSHFFSCGGDTTLSLAKRFGAYGFSPYTEVLPFAVYGYLLNESGDRIHLVTKGGMIGDDNAMKHCVQYLATNSEGVTKI